jgi:threonine/homoserine/homoserine lactone efflux protein
MFPFDIWVAYTAASILIVLAPGPDTVLAIARGLSQGWMAATVSSLGAGTGVLIHATAAALGLAWIIQTSTTAFVTIKLFGAAYLIWLGARALYRRDLVSLVPAGRQPIRVIYLTAFLSDVLNPKIALFVLAFIPQFVSSERGSVPVQLLVYGLWLAVIVAVGVSIVGGSVSALSRVLIRRPRLIAGINIGAGLAFVTAGFSALVAKSN